jgi:hypothetical protein
MFVRAAPIGAALKRFPGEKPNRAISLAGAAHGSQAPLTEPRGLWNLVLRTERLSGKFCEGSEMLDGVFLRLHDWQANPTVEAQAALEFSSSRMMRRSASSNFGALPSRYSRNAAWMSV